MSIQSKAFRDVLRHFPAGVTLVTVRSGEDIHGLTVSAFASVSPDPPLILVCLDHRGRGYQLMERSDAVFAVNILREGQEEFANRFAFSDEDRFAVGNWSTAETGAPVFGDGIAWLDCTVYSRHTAGTNTVYIGEVQASKVIAPDAAPLVYWNRDYHTLASTVTADK